MTIMIISKSKSTIRIWAFEYYIDNAVSGRQLFFSVYRLVHLSRFVVF